MGLFGRKVQPQAATARDPVCGMDVDPLKAQRTDTHLGKAYYFCSLGCAERFKASPAQYVK